MAQASAIANGFAKNRGAGMCTSFTAIGSVNFAIACKIREIYNFKTAETLAVWLKIAVRTAKHRLSCSREFTIDELETLLHSEHGFKILGALMERAGRKPAWWNICEPLMELADAELLVAAIKARTSAVNSQREDVDALETEIRRAQAIAIHGSGPARAHVDALRSMRGVVAPKAKR